MLTAIFIFVAFLAILNTAAEFARDLMMFQQNSYRADRYGRWLSESGDTTSMARLCGIFVFLLALAGFSFRLPAAVIVGIFCAWNCFTLGHRKYKKPLVWTMRARRIIAVMWALTVIVAAAGVLLFGGGNLELDLFVVAECMLLCYCASHIIVMLANAILTPVEKSINRKYYREAEDALRSMPALKIIGVTGSYGKTSTKHYLYRILSEQYQTLMTPGNFNTTLGVIRTVREHLKPYHEVFIVEMGAKQIGDIKEICDLVHPTVGIVTAVGPQHLESFKSIANVQSTKFELVDSLPSDGLAVVNNDFEKIADRTVTNVPCERYAVAHVTDEVDYYAEDIRYSAAGTTFTAVCRHDGHRLELTTRLVGECNISNLLAAVAVARYMGVTDDRIRYAVEKIEQVEHRLSIKKIPGGYTIIDDAYNSNPVGSAMALDVLAAMPGKRILLTPGMVELGTEQFDRNRDFGQKAATCCDIAIVVGHYNRDAILEGLKAGGMPETAIRRVDTFAEAQALLGSLAGNGDTVLYENDLPDTFK